MKAIMISIKPKYVAKILNEEKTVEIKKTMPKCDLPIDVYIYCTKDNKNLLHKNCANIYWIEDKDFKTKNKKLGIETQPYLNGKVVAKFTLNKVVRYVNGCKLDGEYSDYEHILKPSCLTEDELYDYCEDLSFYAWHISNLVIFDKPKELSEFIQTKRKNYEEPNVKRPPQSWCYIETGE